MEILLEDIFWIIPLLFFFVFLILVGNIYSSNMLALQTESDINTIMGYKFCKSQGYDNYAPGKDYSERFGKITCISCYGGDCESKEFKVHKTSSGLKRNRGYEDEEDC